MYTSGAASASQLAALSASSDIPTTSELASLAQALRERKKLNARRLENVHTDENDVLAGRLSRSDVRSMSLADVLDGAEGSGRRSRSRSASRPERSAPLGTQSSSSSKQGKSRPGLAISPPPVVASPAPGTPVDSSRPKIKVKRDPDHERERSAGATSVTSASGSHVPLSGTARAGLAASPGLEADWDDEGPARPGRTYFNKRKRNRTSATDRDSGDEISQSEMDSPHPGSGPRHQGDSSWSRPESMFSGAHGSSSTFKLKLNPTAQTAAHKVRAFPECTTFVTVILTCHPPCTARFVLLRSTSSSVWIAWRRLWADALDSLSDTASGHVGAAQENSRYIHTQKASAATDSAVPDPTQRGGRRLCLNGLAGA